MRKLAITLAAATAAAGLAVPASAQYYPQPAYGYGYAQPAYGYAPVNYRYGTNPAIAANLTARVQGIRYQVRDLANRRAISGATARSLDSQALSLDRSIRSSAWNGISPNERYSLERRISRLEQKVVTASYRSRYAPRRAGYRSY